jgi:hypothetical protein
MHVCATLRSAVTRLREKNTKIKRKYQKKKVTKSLYFTYAWGRPYPTDCNGSLHIGLVTNVINRVNFCGCRLRGLVSAKGRI